MIVTSRALTCNFCGEWGHIDDTETAREARKRAWRVGWRTLPNADQRGRLMDACPKCVSKNAAAAGNDAGVTA